MLASYQSEWGRKAPFHVTAMAVVTAFPLATEPGRKRCVPGENGNDAAVAAA